MKCPCHSGLTYETCCAPYHQGSSPPTAMALMRSRYSAYSLKLVTYILETTHPEHPDSKIPISKRKEQIEAFCTQTQFLGLQILETDENSVHPTVTFKATLTQKGQDASFTEKSEFAKDQGKWKYLRSIFLEHNPL